MAGDLAALASLLGPAGAVIILAVAGAIKGKGNASEPAAATAQAQVVAASFVDSQSLRELTRAIDRNREQAHEDSQAERSAMENLMLELRRNTSALGDGTISQSDLLGLIARMGRMKGPGE